MHALMQINTWIFARRNIVYDAEIELSNIAAGAKGQKVNGYKNTAELARGHKKMHGEPLHPLIVDSPPFPFDFL